jgi:PTS system mannose-specific IIA component
MRIVVITHGNLAKALVETSKLIIGDECEIDTIGLFLGDNPEEFRTSVSNLIDKNLTEEGLLVFSDLYGGTPANSIMLKMNELKIPDKLMCFVGVNLPILLEAISLSRFMKIDEVSTHIEDISAGSIRNITNLIKPA